MKPIPVHLLADDLSVQQLDRIFVRHYGSKRVAADLAGVGAPYITKILRGQQPPPPRILEILRQMARNFVISDHDQPKAKRKPPQAAGRAPRMRRRIS
jgi:hypothetical protein